MEIFVSLPDCYLGSCFITSFFFQVAVVHWTRVFKRQLFSIGKALDEEI